MGLKAALILFPLLVVPVAMSVIAQDDGGAVVHEDPSGDARLEAATGAQQEIPRSDYDLLRIEFIEDSASDMVARVQLAAWNGPDGRATAWTVEGKQVSLHFRFAEKEHRLFYRPVSSSPCGEGVALETFEAPGARWILTECLPAIVDVGAALLEVSLPKESVRDPWGAPLRFGSSMDDLYATVRGGTASPYDRAPDAGFAGPLKVLQGRSGDGAVQLSSPRPLRVSNGEATSFAFPLVVDNLGSETEPVFLSIDELPPGWSAWVPPRVVVEPGQPATVPVIASLPFRHDHGESESVVVAAREGRDDSTTARFPLAVRWLDVPQPAGHHPFLHFYHPGYGVGESAASRTMGWMNADPQDGRPGAGQAAIPPSNFGVFEGTEARLAWEFQLDPSLAIGLDFDLARRGTFEVRIRSEAPQALQNAKVSFVLSLVRGGSSIMLANGTSEPALLVPGQDHRFAGVLVPTSEADLVTFQEGDNLVGSFSLAAASAAPNDQHFLLETRDAVAELPLTEYHDPVEQALQMATRIGLAPRSATEGRAAPGAAIAFEFDLSNRGGEPAEVSLGIEGVNRDWASWSGPATRRVEAQSAAVVRLLVRVPEDASAGERAELFAVAHNTAEALEVAVARVRAIADPQALGEDPLAEDGARRTPAPAGIVVLLSWLAGVARRRS